MGVHINQVRAGIGSSSSRSARHLMFAQPADVDTMVLRIVVKHLDSCTHDQDETPKHAISVLHISYQTCHDRAYCACESNKTAIHTFGGWPSAAS